MDEFLGLELLCGCTCSFDCFCQFACQRAGIGDHTSFGNEDFVAEKSECLGMAVALGVPALHLRGCPGSGVEPVLPVSLWSPVGTLLCPGLAERLHVSTACRFSTKSWLSQVCHVCQKSMMFGVKCKHCR